MPKSARSVLYQEDGANYSEQGWYPMVELTVLKTGRPGKHAYQFRTTAMGRNSSREVNIFLSRELLEALYQSLTIELEATADAPAVILAAEMQTLKEDEQREPWQEKPWTTDLVLLQYDELYYANHPEARP